MKIQSLIGGLFCVCLLFSPALATPDRVEKGWRWISVFQWWPAKDKPRDWDVNRGVTEVKFRGNRFTAQMPDIDISGVIQGRLVSAHVSQGDGTASCTGAFASDGGSDRITLNCPFSQFIGLLRGKGASQ
jgi:hypothetical protein